MLTEAAAQLPEAYQVGLWVEAGRDQAEIARLLGKTPRTVRNHLDALRWFLIRRLLDRALDAAEVASLLRLPREVVTQLIERKQRDG